MRSAVTSTLARRAVLSRVSAYSFSGEVRHQRAYYWTGPIDSLYLQFPAPTLFLIYKNGGMAQVLFLIATSRSCSRQAGTP